jgi:DNA-binding LacI/PurR family transcriptional regulator
VSEPRAVIMADVATAAGVSLMTVSRVLNGAAGVAPSTRRRVERAVQRLGYRPNAAARTLATGRSGTIGVVSVETPYYGPASTLFGIEAAARAVGLFVSFVAVRDVDAAHMHQAIEHTRGTNVDGIVIVAPVPAARDAVDAVDFDVPVVVLQGTDIDQTEGARLATQHLVDMGHREIVHVRGPRGWIEAELRATEFDATMRAGGLRARRPLVGDWTARSGYELGRRLAAVRSTTAVFVANDQMALGVLRALHEAGRQVPDDVSVVGFDDIPEAAFFEPPLTTVRQDFDELGRRCVQRLVAVLGGTGSVDADVVTPTLVVRASASSRHDGDGARP